LKKYPKIVQVDKRGQIVIPKDIRSEVCIDEGTGFYVYSIGDDSILLKKIPLKELDQNDNAVNELLRKGEKIGISKKKIEKAVEEYKKTKQGRLEII